MVKVQVTVKVKVILHSTKMYSGRRGIGQPILNVVLEGGEWSALDGVLLPPVTTEKKPRWASELVWTTRRKEKSFARSGNE